MPYETDAAGHACQPPGSDAAEASYHDAPEAEQPAERRPAEDDRTVESIRRLYEMFGALTAAQEQNDRRQADLADRLESVLAGVGEVRQLLGALGERTASLDAVLRYVGETLPALVGKAEANAENVQRIRELIATLPEIAGGQAEAVAGIEQRVEALADRTAATSDAVAQVARGLEDTKQGQERMGQLLAACQQPIADLASNQQQLSKMVNSLARLVSQEVELTKNSAGAIQSMAADRTSQFEEVERHVTKENVRLRRLTVLALVLSGVAAAAAVTAAVAVLMR